VRDIPTHSSYFIKKAGARLRRENYTTQHTLMQKRPMKSILPILDIPLLYWDPVQSLHRGNKRSKRTDMQCGLKENECRDQKDQQNFGELAGLCA